MTVLSGVTRNRVRQCLAVLIAGVFLTGCGGAANNDTFDLRAASVRADGPSAHTRQILVPEPLALKALNSEQILVRVSTSEVRYLSNSQWSDKLPRMVQAKLVQAYENTGKLGGVGKPGQGLAIDYQIASDIRAFEIDAATNRARVEISVKLLNDRNGTVKAQKVFSAAAPVSSGATNPAFIKALDVAFSSVATEIVDWTLRSL